MNPHVVGVIQDSEDTLVGWLSGHNHERRNMALRGGIIYDGNGERLNVSTARCGQKQDTTIKNYGGKSFHFSIYSNA